MRTLRASGGFAAPVFLLGLAVVLTGILGIGVDAWRVMGAHARLQSVAEAAALAGASGIDLDALYAAEGVGVPLDAGHVEEAVCHHLERLIISACPGSDVEVVVDDDTVTVRLARPLTLGPMRLLFTLTGGPSDVRLQATASAAPFRQVAEDQI